MFPSFTGSARPKRQVNLSGRNSNPFAAHSGTRTSSSPQTAQNALAQAQQERILRQQERERPPAAIMIQKTWRGFRDRKELRETWRHAWDLREGWGQGNTGVPYQSEEECLGQLRLISQFASPFSVEDGKRLQHFARRYSETVQLMPSALVSNAWSAPLRNLASIVVRTLKFRTQPTRDTTSTFALENADYLLRLLQSLSENIPLWLAVHSPTYYKSLADVAAYYGKDGAKLLKGPVLALLYPNHEGTDKAYQGFASEILCVSYIFATPTRQEGP